VACILLALAHNETLLAQENPGLQRPVRQQEIDRLKRQIEQDASSNVEAVVDYHTESGDLNNRLDYLRYGARLNLRWGSSSTIQLAGTRTDYRPISSLYDEQGTNFTAGLHTQVSDSVAAHFEAGATRFSTSATSVNAHASVTYSASDDARVYFAATRTNVEESLLSATGLRPVAGPFAGQLVGRVMENRFVGGGATRLFGIVDVFGAGGAGNRAGSNVPSNFFKTVGGGAGYSIIATPDEEPLSLLRAAYEVNYFGFRQNRLGFGGASLLTRGGSPLAPNRIGSDGMSPDPGLRTAGTGGYFSPENFVSNIARVEAKGGSSDGLSYEVSGFAGFQDYSWSPVRFATGFAGTVSVALTERVSLPVTYLIDNFGPYRQQSVYARLVVRF
jgi:hypothetical protein